MSAGRDPHAHPIASLTPKAGVAAPEGLSTFLRHSAHAMLVVGVDGHILAANARAEPLLNSATADVLGRPFADFLVEADRARFRKRLDLARASGEAVEDVDVHLARPEDGLVAVSFLRLDAERVVLQVRDLTREQEHRSRALAEEGRALREHDSVNRKMIDLGGLISGVAHELRTPITYVANNLALEKRIVEDVSTADPTLGARLREALAHNEAAMEGVERVRRLLHELRPLTKNKPHRTVRMDLAEIAMDAVRTFRATHTGQTRIRLDLQSTHPLAIDREDVTSVLVNLLNNAAQAMGERGTIRVVTRNQDVPPTIRVIDEGPGVPNALKPRLGEPFFTTKPDGTGLGLFISRRTIEAHGGAIAIEDTPGGGATFVVTLPETDA